MIAYLDGNRTNPLTPAPIAFHGEALPRTIFGYECWEGIKFAGDRVFVTVEARPFVPLPQ